MNVPDARMLYAPTLRYDVLGGEMIDETVDLALGILALGIKADEVAAGKAIDF
jgi:hypothetical protein